MTKVDFIYFDAGGGHRAAATALKAVIDEQKRPPAEWDVRMVNLQEILGPLDVFRKVTGLECRKSTTRCWRAAGRWARRRV